VFAILHENQVRGASRQDARETSVRASRIFARVAAGWMSWAFSAARLMSLKWIAVMPLVSSAGFVASNKAVSSVDFSGVSMAVSMTR
jgi:hypothetical protein